MDMNSIIIAAVVIAAVGIIEHKWFEFGKDENGNDLPKTIISCEYSSEWKPGDEPYYPVNDAKNGALEYSCRKSSSSIIRKQLPLDIAILPQATAYCPFHTLFALSFLIGCLFLLQK